MLAMLFAFLPALLGLGRRTLAADPQEQQKAGIDDQAKAAYFVLPTAGHVFALNVADNGDVYYHMNAPVSHSWMGVGFGGSMSNSRMLISHLGADGSTLVNSCRYSTGHSEPEHDPSCIIENISNDTYAPFSNTLSPDGIMIAHGVCRGCAVWHGGQLNRTDTAQQFIFALGPNRTLLSDSLSANLRLHQSHGSFTMDMNAATNVTGWYGRVPAPQDPGLQVGDAYWAFANHFSTFSYTADDQEWAPLAHGVIMILAFVLVFPVGALSLRLLKRVVVHAAAQVVGFLFIIAGLGISLYTSKMYNKLKSKDFKSAHQIIGLLIFAGILVQIGLGFVHHLVYLKSKGPSIMGKIHRFLGIAIMVVGIANAGVGFNFAGDTASNVPYGIVVALMGAVFCGLMILILYYNSKNVYRPEKEEVYRAAQYGDDVPAEYEMHTAFAQMGHVQTPRTPFFGAPNLEDPEDYRSHFRQQKNATQTSGWTDTPTSDVENPFKAKWEAGSHG